MIAVLVLTIAIVMVAMIGMAVGLILKGKPMRGGCRGGQHAPGDKCASCTCETPEEESAEPHFQAKNAR